jgi:hypothetical protein
VRPRDSEKASGLLYGPHEAITNADGLVHSTLLGQFDCRRSRQSLSVPGSAPPLQNPLRNQATPRFHPSDAGGGHQERFMTLWDRLKNETTQGDQQRTPGARAGAPSLTSLLH